MDALATRGLLFIPDISGFSRFVNQTEIEHSRLIIQELLETLIDANRIGLEISEIEGDAILFYRFGDLPALADLSAQVEHMFCAFQRSILAYDVRKYCQCRACVRVVDLTLKVITHYGEFTGYNVREFRKLIGRDVIVAHELLKNDIDHHEYWLVTQNLLPEGRAERPAPWVEWRPGSKVTQTGPISFRYTGLSPLRASLTPEPSPRTPTTDGVQVISLSGEYDTDIITLFHATGDFNYRSRWRDGVTTVEEVGHFLPRVGMRCRCILESGETVTYASSYSYRSDRIEFTETEEGTGNVTAYLLERVGERRTRLTLRYFVPRSPAAFLFRLIRKRDLEQSLERSLENLVGLVREIRVDTSAAPA